MRQTLSDRLAKLEQKQAVQRQRIIDEAVNRLVLLWELTPPEAQERFREMINPTKGDQPA